MPRNSRTRFYRCFVCKRQYPLGWIVKQGKRKDRNWYLCRACSQDYAQRIHAEMTKKAWKGGVLCPHCESWRRYELGRAPTIVHCGDCDFVFTLNA